MTRLSGLTHDDLDDAQAALWDAIVGTRQGSIDLIGDDGALVGPFNSFLHAPELGRRLSSLGAHLRFGTSIERRLSEVAICTVGAHWRSDFEFWAHAPMAVEHGVDASAVEALRAGTPPVFTHDDERLVHELTSKLLIDRRVDDATYAAGVELLGEAGMIELAALIGYYCLISITLNLFEVAVPAGDSPVFRET